MRRGRHHFSINADQVGRLNEVGARLTVEQRNALTLRVASRLARSQQVVVTDSLLDRVIASVLQELGVSR